MGNNRGSLIALCSIVAIASAGCSSHREFRVASIGSDGSFEIAGDEDDSNTQSQARTRSRRAPLVTSGNVLMGSGTGVLNAQLANGTVTGVLGRSGQTVVGLVNGTTVVLNGSGGSLGDLVSIDLGAGQVVGGPSSLVGVSVLASSSGTHQASVGSTSVTGGTSVNGVTSVTGVTGGTGGTAVTGVTGVGATTGALLPAPSASGGVSGAVTGTVTGTASGTVGGVPGSVCC
jgi:hypothetical protein